MRPTGPLRFVRREGYPHPVLQQEMIGFKKEVWENEVLISAEGVLQKYWVDITEIDEPT